MSRTHTIGLLVPLLAALSPMALGRIRLGKAPQPVVALMGGALVAVVTWLLLRFVPLIKESDALPKSVLLGILVAEVLLFHSSSHLPSMTTLSLFMFLYFFSTESKH